MPSLLKGKGEKLKYHTQEKKQREQAGEKLAPVRNANPPKGEPQNPSLRQKYPTLLLSSGEARTLWEGESAEVSRGHGPETLEAR